MTLRRIDYVCLKHHPGLRDPYGKIVELLLESQFILAEVLESSFLELKKYLRTVK